MGLFDKLKSAVETSLDASIQANLAKAAPVTEDLKKKEYSDGTYGRKGLMWDPFTYQAAAQGLYQQKHGYLNPLTLKLAARRDPIVGAIIHLRAQQVSEACQEQVTHYDMGFKLKPVNPAEDSDPKEIEAMKNYILNCGHEENRNSKDKLTFDQWGYLATADLLRYGHTAIERIYNRGGDLTAFLPLAGESIFYASKTVSKDFYEKDKRLWNTTIKSIDSSYEPTKEEDSDQEGDVEYVQVLSGHVTETFTAKEMIFCRLYLEADIELMGYAVSPLERAISMISNHLNIEKHQAMFFTHGFASKGILVIQGDVSPNNMRALTAQWTAQTTGTQNAWRTPILSGIKGVQWVPLSPPTRDMEYAAYQDHVLRTIHSCFSIDPEETGFGYLSKGTEQRSMGEAQNEWKLTASRDKGLRPILARLASVINEEVLPFAFPELSKKYKFSFAGLDAETRGEETARLQTEVSLHKSLGEARKESGMEPLPFGNGLILNPILLAYLEKNLPKGVFMETFLGIQGASQRPDLQYIPDPFWFQNQQTQMAMLQQQAMAGAGGGEGEEGGEKRPSKESGGENDEAAQEQAQEQAQQEQAAMAAAADAYIQGNPHLFKSMNDNLMKSKAAFYKVPSVHRKLSPIANHMSQEYRKAGIKLISDIMKAVAEDEINKVEPKKAD